MSIKERIEEIEDQFETEAEIVERLVDEHGYSPRSVKEVYRTMKGTLGVPSRPDQRRARGLDPEVRKVTCSQKSRRRMGVVERPGGMRTKSVHEVVDEENLDPMPKIISVCGQIPDGELIEPDDLRNYIGGISKTEWSKHFLRAAELTSFRCRISKNGRTYFGNDREISKMKRKRGVE